MASTDVNQIIGTVEQQYAKLPPLPKPWVEVFVKVAPWISLIFGILGVLTSIAAFGILTFLAPFVTLGGGVGSAANGVIGSVLALVSSALLLASFPGLRDRKLAGWRLLFYSEVVSLISSVVFFSVGGVVWALVWFYILFQMKSHYR